MSDKVPPVPLKKGVSSREEVTARTVGCHDCGAPIGQGCQRIVWSGNMPRLDPRRYHGGRLRWAKRLAQRSVMNEDLRADIDMAMTDESLDGVSLG